MNNFEEKGGVKVKEGRGYVYTAGVLVVISIMLLVFVLMGVTTGYAAISEADCRACHGDSRINTDCNHIINEAQG